MEQNEGREVQHTGIISKNKNYEGHAASTSGVRPERSSGGVRPMEEWLLDSTGVPCET